MTLSLKVPGQKSANKLLNVHTCILNKCLSSFMCLLTSISLQLLYFIGFLKPLISVVWTHLSVNHFFVMIFKVIIKIQSPQLESPQTAAHRRTPTLTQKQRELYYATPSHGGRADY